MRLTTLLISVSMLGLLLQACAQPAPDTAPGGTSPVAKAPTDSGSTLSQAQPADLRQQVEENWNINSVSADPVAMKQVVIVHVRLDSTGKVVATEVENDRPDDPHFQQLKQSALRAILMASPFKLPPGKTYSALTFRFAPGEVR